MYQSIISLILLTHLGAFASKKEITKAFENFNTKKVELFKADINKKNIKEKLNIYLNDLNVSYDQIKVLEIKEKNSLSPEGNEIAYNLELLEPLKLLASENINPASCEKANAEHKLNFPVVEDETAKKIQNIINKVCN